MKKPSAQKGDSPKVTFTIRLDPILTKQLKELSKVKKISIISIIEAALTLYFGGISK